jgi:hypothetical protein
MLRIRPNIVVIISCLLAMLAGGAIAHAQDGKLKIRVTPKQAYVFVDGQPIRDGKQTISLSAGTHSIGVYNYGFTPQTQDVTITSAKTTPLNVTLQASGGMVSGPFGYIQIEGNPRAAVMLNGKTPGYFVGQADEFDNYFIWRQQLLVAPGTYQVNVVQKDKTLWSGPVSVKAGQRAIVYLEHEGKMKMKDWKEGNTLGPQPRFRAGIASATVAVAPVSAQFSAQQTQINCGDSTRLTWNSAEVGAANITGIGDVPATGERTVSPTQTTTYNFVASGPGGDAKGTVTVNVNAQPTSTLNLSNPEIRYHKVGDKVEEQGSTTLTWSTANASKVTLNPLNATATSGSQTIQATPRQTTVGPVNETVNYTLSSANVCGGTSTQTAALHIIGSIDPVPAPAPSLSLNSLFYPTNYPRRASSKVGLVASQQATLTELANNFKTYSKYDTAAKLLVVGHADERGPERYNVGLSQRRADRTKDFLVSQGIPADKIETRADGESNQLTAGQVANIESSNPVKPPAYMTRKPKATQLAYNRRADVILEPSGKESTLTYPNSAADARVLWQRVTPSVRSLQTAE